MKLVLLSCCLISWLTYSCSAQAVGPPNNVGREYGNPKMPLFVSHLAGANKERLKRANKNSRHSIFAKILCFRKLCRIQSGHSASLKAISFKKFRKKIARNAKRGEYKNIKADTTQRRKPMIRQSTPVKLDSVVSFPTIAAPIAKTDSLIVLGAEVLFETNKSTLRSEHFTALKAIVDYLRSEPERKIRISGHTDNTGKESHNLNLSKQRADVVAEYLVMSGIDINRVETAGLGSTKPISTNATEDGRRKNRRVEILVYDEGP
jgi:outer membrane protein OmpA-like peptidoglycan-associated protein